MQQKKRNRHLTIALAAAAACASPAFAATPFSVPFEFDSFDRFTLDRYSERDDSALCPAGLGFSVEVGGVTFDHFRMEENGLVRLLSGPELPPLMGYGPVAAVLAAAPSGTFLFAGYDDLNPAYGGFYGYKLLPDRAIFYYDTQTWMDSGTGFFNNFEVELFRSGRLQWNFRTADYTFWDYDLFSGVYLGGTGELVTIASGYLPAGESWAVPVPGAAWLLASGGALVLGMRRKKRAPPR